MNFTEFPFENSQNYIKWQYIILITVISGVCWFLINRFALTVPKTIKESRIIKYKNLQTSLIHAALSATVSTIAFFAYILPAVNYHTDLLTMNPKSHPDVNFQLGQFVGAISMGYFIYDMLDYRAVFLKSQIWGPNQGNK